MVAPLRTWIVVADAARARILVERGPADGRTPAEIEDLVATAAHARSRERGSDRPGRAHESVGGARHAEEPKTDPHRHEKRRFARQVAERLETGAQKGEFDKLFVIAPAQMLGDLRAELGSHAKQRLAGELAKDLTRHSVAEIAAHVDETNRR